MANRFIIVCAARTGSTLLRLLLQSHPDICCHGELITPDERRVLQVVGTKADVKSNVRDLLMDVRRTDPARFLRDFALYPGRFLAVGLKIKYSEFVPEVMGSAHDWVLENSDIKILHLRRHNLLRRHVSHQLALQTGVTMVLQGGDVPEYKSLHLNFQDCVEDFERVRAEEDRFSALFSKHPVIDVSYEAVIDPRSGECDRILDFLGVHRAPLTAKMVKLGRGNLAELVENYQDLQQQARGTRYAHFFD